MPGCALAWAANCAGGAKRRLSLESASIASAVLMPRDLTQKSYAACSPCRWHSVAPIAKIVGMKNDGPGGLDKRKAYILATVVYEYIATAEPVGSQTLTQKYNLGVSSATVRN